MKLQASRFFVVAGLLSTPLLAGCSGSSGSSSAPLITPQPRSVSAKTANGLTATLSEDVDAVSQVGSVTYTVALTNRTSQPITMQIPTCAGSTVDPSHPNATVTIADATGAQIYPVYNFIGAPPPPCVSSSPVAQTLAPGQILTESVKLNAVSAPQIFNIKGVYTLKASVQTFTLGSGPDAVGPLPLTVQ